MKVVVVVLFLHVKGIGSTIDSRNLVLIIEVFQKFCIGFISYMFCDEGSSLKIVIVVKQSQFRIVSWRLLVRIATQRMMLM